MLSVSLARRSRAPPKILPVLSSAVFQKLTVYFGALVTTRWNWPASKPERTAWKRRSERGRPWRMPRHPWNSYTGIGPGAPGTGHNLKNSAVLPDSLVSKW